MNANLRRFFRNEDRAPGVYDLCMKPAVLLSLFAAPVLAQSVVDPNLRVQNWVSGLDRPSGFVFLDQNGTGLALEKNTGQVKLVQNRSASQIVLDLPVSNDSERGLLGIALSPNFTTDNLVYLYYTAASQDGGAPIVNAIKRYRWDPLNQSLTFHKKIADLPATPGANHNGGKIQFGPDGKLYAVIGDLNRNELTSNHDGSDLTRSGAILRLNSSGSSVTTNPFYDSSRKTPANDIFAYGVRNSFGMAFDPVSGSLWMSENGPSEFDEINRIYPGFNSGWERIMGPSDRNGGIPGGLVSLGDRAAYGDPEIAWATPVAPTAMMFFPNQRLGKDYKNDLFVGSVRGGKIFQFQLTPSRKDLLLEGDLSDKVADNNSSDRFAEQEAILWGNDFGTVTELLYGPGGMYVLSHTNGILSRITSNPSPASAALGMTVPEPATLAICAFPLLARRSRRF